MSTKICPSAAYIEISVNTKYILGHLPEEENKYAFAYKITIYNNGNEQVQLLNRYWLITDANSKKTEVRGSGVIGEQPIIAAGQRFQYTSGVIIDTPVGTMQGHYEMQCPNGDLFEAPIVVFGLAVPNVIN
jgi:ApaG protein